MKKYLVGISLIAFCIISCNEEKSKTTDSVSADTSAVENSSPFTATTDTGSSVGMPVEIAPAASQLNTNPALSSPSASSPSIGMNPAHGEPGHRCDIAVGAPLNSPPGDKNAPNPGTATQPVTLDNSATQIQLQPPAQPNIPPQEAPQIQQTPTTTAPGMNPPHGEPGHRCDISVGAPLNSPPNNPVPATPK